MDIDEIEAMISLTEDEDINNFNLVNLLEKTGKRLTIDYLGPYDPFLIDDEGNNDSGWVCGLWFFPDYSPEKPMLYQQTSSDDLETALMELFMRVIAIQKSFTKQD